VKLPKLEATLFATHNPQKRVNNFEDSSAT